MLNNSLKCNFNVIVSKSESNMRAIDWIVCEWLLPSTHRQLNSFESCSAYNTFIYLRLQITYHAIHSICIEWPKAHRAINANASCTEKQLKKNTATYESWQKTAAIVEAINSSAANETLLLIYQLNRIRTVVLDECRICKSQSAESFSWFCPIWPSPVLTNP